MKKFISGLLTIFGIVLAFQMVMTSCEGPEGPEGPAGPMGGDGSAVCGECHDLTTDLTAKIAQWETSVHLLGGTAARGTSASCARCHCSEGFVAYVEGGEEELEEGIAVPTQIGCRTCHNIHTDYTASDWALTVVTPFELDIVHTKATFDIGSGNLCVRCHQPRDRDYPEVGGPDYEITSTHWGYHHGPQGALYVGEGGYRIPGSVNYDNLTPKHYNAVDNGCVDCHMAMGNGLQSGGHTWRMATESGSENVDACTPCHAAAEDFNYMGGQEDIEHLLDSLEVLLTAAGVMDGGHVVPATYTADEAGSYLNWLYIEEDRSLGVHNYALARALLVNSIEAMAKK